MYQLLVSGGVVGLFLQVVPITCLVGIIYAVYRCIRIKKQQLSVKWGIEILRWLFVCYLTHHHVLRYSYEIVLKCLFFFFLFCCCFCFFFFKQKTAYEISACLVGSEMCIRDRNGLKYIEILYRIIVCRHLVNIC